MSNREYHICNTLNDAGCEYEEAIRQMEVLATQFAGRDQHTDVSRELQTIASRVKTTAGRVAAARRSWKDTGQRSSPQLEKLLRQEEVHLRRLINRFDVIQESLQNARLDLVPMIDAHFHSQQMQSAYSRVVRQAAE